MKSYELIIIVAVLLVVLFMIIQKTLKYKNKLLTFWLTITIFTVFYVSFMLLNKKHVANYSCSNKYWHKKDYNFDKQFLLDTYGEYKCGCDMRYDEETNFVYTNELFNILISIGLLCTFNNIPLFKNLLLLQFFNTIIYFVTLEDFSNWTMRKTIYLGISALYVVVPAILFHQELN